WRKVSNAVDEDTGPGPGESTATRTAFSVCWAPPTNGATTRLTERTTASPITRMNTWYDITGARRPQAARQFPSSEGGGYGYSRSGGRTGTTTDVRAPRRSRASSRQPRTSRPGRRVESI